MNPVAIRLLNQQLIAPQFSTPTEVVSYIVAEFAKYLGYYIVYSRQMPQISIFFIIFAAETKNS